MKVLRLFCVAIALLAPFAAGTAQAAATTNYADQWWIPAEPGWGASVHQQSDMLFVDVLVYGVDGKPTWFVAAASLNPGSAAGHTVFSGDLYATTGPYYGGAFDPSSVVERKVGTLTFDAVAADSATISYTVDGVPVVKRVTRETWGYEDLTGSYYGGWNADKSGCMEGPLNAPPVYYEDPLTITIDHGANNEVTMRLQFADLSTISLTGTYSQSGHLGRIVGEFDQAGPTWSYGTIALIEIESTSAGFTARFSGDLMTARLHDWCDLRNGRIGGVRR